MAFIDELKIHMKAGDGGDGVVRWLQEKGKDRMGPAGGNGGNGGGIYARAIRDLGVLAKYRNKREFKAEDGQDGMEKNMYGKNAPDLVIDFPLGSLITNLSDGTVHELLQDGETTLILKGGRGGLGNEHFKASTNRSPRQFTEGKIGEAADFFVELRLLVDAGIIGLPNAGKSSLLNVLTNADAKVGSYAFTTLEPNLGDFFGFILADIPGLIEGASKGKGLGDKFLRHIKRTKILLHCISLENEDLQGAYKIIRKELEDYDKDLAEKKEIIILTKTDVVDAKHLGKTIKEMKKLNPLVLSVSVYDDVSIKKFGDELVKIFRSV
ncbi:MAG: Obg family GTPase CgtA [Candidatus Taylorbacteria bacterium]